MVGYYLCRIINIEASFQAYKKVALSNSSNFGHKVVKMFSYLDCLMIQSAKRKLEYLHVISDNQITKLFS